MRSLLQIPTERRQRRHHSSRTVYVRDVNKMEGVVFSALVLVCFVLVVVITRNKKFYLSVFSPRVFVKIIEAVHSAAIRFETDIARRRQPRHYQARVNAAMLLSPN